MSEQCIYQLCVRWNHQLAYSSKAKGPIITLERELNRESFIKANALFLSFNERHLMGSSFAMV